MYNLPVNYTKLRPEEKSLVREEYAKAQEGLCWYCKAPLETPPRQDKPVNKRLFPPGFFTHPVHLQHDHDTGLTEGAVHAYCNAVLWEYHGK